MPAVESPGTRHGCNGQTERCGVPTPSGRAAPASNLTLEPPRIDELLVIKTVDHVGEEVPAVLVA